MFPLDLLAQAAPPRGSPFERPEVLWGTAGLAAALFLGALVVYVVDRWRKRDGLRDRAAGGELTTFRAMYERGEITDEEYARLRQKVADRVKPPPAAAEAPPPAAGTPPPPAPPATRPGLYDDTPGPGPNPAAGEPTPPA